MSNKFRWCCRDTNHVMAAVDAETVIEIGDLLYQEIDDARPASQFTSDFSNPRDELFADKFLGVAMQQSRAGETAPIRVATTGMFEFDCLSDTFELGDLVGVAMDMQNVTLFNQRIDITNIRGAIGRVAKRQATAATSVMVDIRSTIMTGGVYAR